MPTNSARADRIRTVAKSKDLPLPTKEASTSHHATQRSPASLTAEPQMPFSHPHDSFLASHSGPLLKASRKIPCLILPRHPTLLHECSRAATHCKLDSFGRRHALLSPATQPTKPYTTLSCLHSLS